MLMDSTIMIVNIQHHAPKTSRPQISGFGHRGYVDLSLRCHWILDGPELLSFERYTSK